MSSAEDSNVDPELRGMDVHRAYRPSSSGPEVLPLGDSAFRLPDHLPAQPPHRASVESSPAAEGQPWAEKTKKNGQGPARLKKACDACSKRKIKVCRGCVLIQHEFHCYRRLGLTLASVTSRVHLANVAPKSTSHVRTQDQVDVEAHETAMRMPSNSNWPRQEERSTTAPAQLLPPMPLKLWHHLLSSQFCLPTAYAPTHY